MAREFAKPFYRTKEWLKCRDYVFKRDNGLCVCCLEKGIEKIGEEVHHIIWLRPSNIDNPSVSTNPDNCITLCKDCHISIHKKSTTKSRLSNRKTSSVTNGVFFDEQGNIQQQKIYIVCGAPGSGKTTYVRQHFSKGDMIVDLDYIKQAITMCDRTDAPDELLEVSEAIRELLYKYIEDRRVSAKTIWVVSSLPTRQQRQSLIDRLNGELIHIEATVQECIEHISFDNERKDKQKQIDIIDKYFGYYEKD